MEYPNDIDLTQGRGSGFANKFQPDSKIMGQATAQLRAYIQQNVIDGDPNEIDRITKYYLFWKFYEGQHYREYNDAMLSFNYVRAFIDKVNMFLLGKDAFSFHVKSMTNTVVDPKFEEAAEQILQYHWNKSKKQTLAYELLQMGSVCGDAWSLAEWQEKQKYVRIKVLDSRQCFPQFKDGDTDNVVSFVVRFPLNIQDQVNNPNKYRLKVYEYTDTTISCWYQKETVNTPKTVRWEEDKQKNPYGFIPIVHIKNKPFAPGYYSKSDAADILKINKVYNEEMQQRKAIIDYLSTPVTVITGGTAKNLTRGLGKIWSGLPPEANVFNLGLDVDMNSQAEFIRDIKTGMHEMSDVPESALGRLQPVSNTSGAALAITYQPLVQQAQMKDICYGDGIAEINTMIFRIHDVHKEDQFKDQYAIMEKIDPDYLDNVRVDPVFVYGFPQDKQNDLNMGIAEIQNKLGSRDEVMKRLGKNNIPDLKKQIDQDQQDDDDHELQMMEQQQEIQQQGMTQVSNPAKKPAPAGTNGKQNKASQNGKQAGPVS